MRLTRIRIENFRSIKSLDLDLGETTVFIGQNNSGKTAILDAIRIALTRRWGQRGTGFTEYDVHLATDEDDPKLSPGVLIEIRAEEVVPGEWPEELQQGLDEIVQADPSTGRSFVSLRVTCAWNPTSESFEPTWNFLNAARSPLVGVSARRINLERFWQYLPVFYLGALRDAEDEFSPRSQFWGRLLKAMKIPTVLEGRLKRVLDLLNKKLLRADPRLANIATTLTGATKVAARDRDGSVDLRLMPLKSWDILSKAEIILRNEPTWPWLPLQRHGQGVQSLSVIFLFQAFVDHLLKELYEPESTAVLALEEPETHLHPQAARTLWGHVNQLPGQKIITTHSPYFVQHVPFRDLRLVHLTDQGTSVCSLPSSFSAVVPHVAALDPIIANSGSLLTFDRATNTLTINGELEESRYRDLQASYGTHAERAVVSGVLRQLRDKSRLFMADDELRALETFARRIRGEIFFAKRWFIVEGQAEYLLVHALARALGYDLDEHGVAVIDAVNNGNPATFAALARALSIPWLAVFDGDNAGVGYCDSIGNRHFSPAVVTQKCRRLPAGHLEQQLLADGLEPELRTILTALGHADAATIDRPTLERRLENYKTAYAAELASRIATDAALAERMPQAFRDAIGELRGLT
ncbi:ATP-dependent endonuclease [Bradyrhizobium liaoningense]|uniref:ATP-dependent nuclease n=1 Tax=Bradyrhizobium liaoningense TaxID=43992 RepID=UPI001BA5CC40|nr:AAA family ATPase [Bradyrhizobium liaoningense]MBR1033978.1 AAA family ATPase [Bradyrhizobium liaoningense]